MALTACGVLTAAFATALCGWADAAPRPTYGRDVAPILSRACVTCHRPGRIGPFSLLTYEDVRPRAARIAEAVASRKMPPWKPADRYGSFVGARRLSDTDVDTIVRWARDGAAEGGTPPPAPPADGGGWELGPPDLIVEMPEAFEVPATGDDIYRCFVFPLRLASDRYVSGIEFHPGNRRVLHHAIVFVDATGEGRRLDGADPGPGYESFGGPGFMPSGALGGWSPGSRPVRMPADSGKRLGRGVDLVVQNHYHPDGVPERDRSSIGIYFHRTAPPKQLITIPILRRDLRIPADEPAYETRTTFTTPAPLEIVSIFPHMHELGRAMKVFATLPDGRDVPLIWIRDWDPRWQGEYAYERPVVVPAGTTLTVEATYDNSAHNPRNPNHPPAVVSWGNSAADEMALCLVQVAIADVADARRIAGAILEQPGLRP